MPSHTKESCQIPHTPLLLAQEGLLYMMLTSCDEEAQDQSTLDSSALLYIRNPLCKQKSSLHLPLIVSPSRPPRMIALPFIGILSLADHSSLPACLPVEILTP